MYIQGRHHQFLAGKDATVVAKSAACCRCTFYSAKSRQGLGLRGLANRGGPDHLSNSRGGGAKVAESINVEVGINVEGGIFWKKLIHKCNKRGVEGGKNLRNL